jgi:hypothetical protein
MAVSVEILSKGGSATSQAVLHAMRDAVRAAGDTVIESATYRGGADWLVVWGMARHDAERQQQVKAGRRTLLWDLGYIQRKKVTGHVRMSIDTDHPQAWLDRTPDDPKRLEVLDVHLRNDADPSGPIILVGLGYQSRAYLGCPDWEHRALDALRREFPGRAIIHRPKGQRDTTRLPFCTRDWETPIADLIKGSSLVVCRHSNCAVDAVIAGVPFRAQDGAAMWLSGKPYTVDNRLQFLRRLAWWQWKPEEMGQAWKFVKEITRS